MKNKQISSFLLLLFALIVILTLYPFFKVGFVTADDLEYYMTMRRGDIFTDAYWYSIGAGRFYFLITKPLYSIPYIVDNFYYTKIIQYSFLLLSFITFMIVIRKIFKLKEFALLVFLLLFAFLSVTPNCFVPIMAYPFFFSFSFTIFLFSILQLLKYIETKKYKYLILSVVLYTIALLFYETFLIFLFFIVAFLLIKNIIEKGKTVLKDKSFYKEVLPFCFVAILYIVIYFMYREMVKNEMEFYAGSSFAKNFSIKNFFKILWNYNKIAIPAYAYYTSQNAMEVNSILATGHHNNFWYILSHVNIHAFINTILQCFVFVYLFLTMKNSIPWKKLLIGAVVAIIFTFSVHILLAVSDKYNTTNWHTHGGYVTSFYSYFSITLLMGIFMYACFKLCYNIKVLRYLVIIFFTSFVFCFSIIIGYSNDNLSRDWQRSQSRFKIMDKLIDKGLFDEIPDNAFIYMNDMSSTSSYLGYDVCTQTFSWKNYIGLKLGKELNICDNFSNFVGGFNHEQDIYCFTKYENIKSEEMFIILSKVNNNSIDTDKGEYLFYDVTSNEAIVYYYAPYKSFKFGFNIPDCVEKPVVHINGIEKEAANCGVNIIRINNKNKKEEITSFRLSSSEPFLVRDFLISNIGYVKSDYQELNNN
ncbi:MAG: hypothetical protein LBQ22_01720 [Bacteroidales bacterium]|jgi:hypothetical protein|nr:hypothetical protein [Bacteroidales bacterium]